MPKYVSAEDPSARTLSLYDDKKDDSECDVENITINIGK
jgi:hypothetical protein